MTAKAERPAQANGPVAARNVERGIVDAFRTLLPSLGVERSLLLSGMRQRAIELSTRSAS